MLKRTPLTRGNSKLKSNSSSLKKSPLKKGSCKIKVKPKTEEQKIAQQEQFEKDVKFYTEEVWNKRPHKCQSCDAWLGNEPNLMFFDHLVEKSPHPELRYEPDNIGLVCSTCHSAKTNGFPTERHQQLIDKAKEKFLK